jgi:hypothetical protein
MARLSLVAVTVALVAGCTVAPSPTPVPSPSARLPVSPPPALPSPTVGITPIPGETPATMPALFVAATVTFADADHGWVGGTTGGSDAIVLETADGGASWRADRLGAWYTGDVANSSGTAWASRLCPEDEPCQPALLRQDGPESWEEIAPMGPRAISFSGAVGILAVVLPGGPRQGSGLPIPQVSVTTDAGTTWTGVPNPCGARDLADVVATGQEFLALCTGQGAGGGQRKVLLAAADPNGPWAVRSTTDDDSLPLDGTKIGIDIAGDGSGWLWGARIALYATDDAGRTWRALDVADGESRIVGAGAALDGGAGYILVGDGSRAETQLLWTGDGRTWERRYAWPDPPCCGG